MNSIKLPRFSLKLQNLGPSPSSLILVQLSSAPSTQSFNTKSASLRLIKCIPFKTTLSLFNKIFQIQVWPEALSRGHIFFLDSSVIARNCCCSCDAVCGVRSCRLAGECVNNGKMGTRDKFILRQHFLSQIRGIF